MKPLWTPSQDYIETTILSRFAVHVGMDNAGFEDLHRWSIENLANFWDAVWDFCGVIGERGTQVIRTIDTVPYARFFPDSKISFAENMLRHSIATPKEPAIIFRQQDGEDRIISGGDLSAQVSLWEQILADFGVVEGDKVAVVFA